LVQGSNGGVSPPVAKLLGTPSLPKFIPCVQLKTGQAPGKLRMVRVHSL